MVNRKNIFSIVLVVILLGVFGALLFVGNASKTITVTDEQYDCVWEDGSVTQESETAAFSMLSGIDEQNIYLQREGTLGRIRAGEAFSSAVALFENGSLAELVEFQLGSVSRLERAALYQTYGDVCFYAGGAFCWDGVAFSRTERVKFRQVRLLSGDFSGSFLKESGAESLVLYGESEFTAKSLVASNVQTVQAREPYFAEGGAIYLNAAGGVRLIAALPNAEVLTLDCDYLDADALSACNRLKRLYLPERLQIDVYNTLIRLFGDIPVPIELIILDEVVIF